MIGPTEPDALLATMIETYGPVIGRWAYEQEHGAETTHPTTGPDRGGDSPRVLDDPRLLERNGTAPPGSVGP